MPERVPVAVLISGTGTNMAALLYASRVEGCPYEIALVASNNPDAAGLRLAETEGVATFVLPHRGLSRDDHDAAMDAAIRKSGAQYIALAGYMRILSPAFIARWRGRIVNIHPSLLPLHKGLDPHGRVLAAGEKITGCTVHLVSEEVDSGDVLAQAQVPVEPGDDVTSLAARVLNAEHALYPKALSEFVRR